MSPPRESQSAGLKQIDTPWQTSELAPGTNRGWPNDLQHTPRWRAGVEVKSPTRVRLRALRAVYLSERERERLREPRGKVGSDGTKLSTFGPV